MKHPNLLRILNVFFVAALVSCFWLGSHCVAQNTDVQLPGARQKPTTSEDAWEAQQKQEAAKKENIKRERDIKKDTDKLLELATELKQYVDKTNENMLSLDVIKKAEQIEKLAHTVKEKMKGP
jgi:hypothetical protein